VEDVVVPLQNTWPLELNIWKQTCRSDDASAVGLSQICLLLYRFSGTISLFHNAL